MIGRAEPPSALLCAAPPISFSTDPACWTIHSRCASSVLNRKPRSRPTLRNSSVLRFAPCLRAFFAARSRFAEDQLAAAIPRGLRQYVLLGAGLDTFAYRHPHPGAMLRVFEVDHPATQTWKRTRLHESGIAIPPSLVFVPVDFERQDLSQALRESGFDHQAPAFFAWLGVTMYLTLEAFEETLRFVASCPAGGGIVFDYALSRTMQDPLERVAFEFMAARVRAAGEPWRTTFVPAELVRQLEAMGFVQVQDLGEEQVNGRYFRGRTDGLRVGSLAHMVCAEVGARPMDSTDARSAAESRRKARGPG